MSVWTMLHNTVGVKFKLGSIGFPEDNLQILGIQLRLYKDHVEIKIW